MTFDRLSPETHNHSSLQLLPNPTLKTAPALKLQPVVAEWPQIGSVCHQSVQRKTATVRTFFLSSCRLPYSTVRGLFAMSLLFDM